MESSSQTTGEPAYPVRFSVEYPDRQLNRLTTAFRLIVTIPILIVAASIGGHGGSYAAGDHGWRIAGGTAGLLFFAPLLMILFRQKYPRWWFDWNRELLKFSNRVGVYVALMDDRYPSTDEEQAVALDFPYPDAKQGLNRWLPLVRDPFHGALPARPVRLRPRGLPLDQPRGGLRAHPGYRRVPTVPLQSVTQHAP
jgi:hypothetical protein